MYGKKKLYIKSFPIIFLNNRIVRLFENDVLAMAYQVFVSIQTDQPSLRSPSYSYRNLFLLGRSKLLLRLAKLSNCFNAVEIVLHGF
jgi:hypothetical protein